MIQVGIVILAVIIGWLYYSQTTATGYENPPPKGITDPAFMKFKNIRFDFGTLKEGSFANLKTYGEYPIRPDGSGRGDIFSDY